MPTMTRTLKHVAQDEAALNTREAKARRDVLAITAAARAESRGLTEDERARADKLRASIDEIAADRESLSTERADLEALAEAERASASVSRISVREASEDDPAGGFVSPRAFFGAVMHASQGRGADPRLARFRATAGSDEQSGASDSYGLFLVPEAFVPNLLAVEAEVDPTVSLVTRVPMAAPVVRIPARTDKTHTSSVSGGLQVYRRAEASSVTATRMQTEMIELAATSLMGLSYATEEILTDSAISFIALLEQGFRDEFAARVLNEKLVGSGAGEFTGVIGHAGTVDVAKESGQAADTINGTNILKMRARCWRYGQAVWLANHDTMTQLMAAHIALTNGSVALFAPGNGVDRPDTLMGRPIYFSEFCKTLGDSGDLVLGVWSQYLQGDYGAQGMADSVHVRFVEHERAFKFWLRNAGTPWWRSPLTPKKSTATLSPFVTLADRA